MPDQLLFGINDFVLKVVPGIDDFCTDGLQAVSSGDCDIPEVGLHELTLPTISHEVPLFLLYGQPQGRHVHQAVGDACLSTRFQKGLA